MLSGSAFLRVVLLFVVAAGLAGLVQLYWLPPSPEPEPAVAADPARPARRIDPTPIPPAPVAPPPPVETPSPATSAPLAQTPAVQAPAPQAAPAPVPVAPPPVTPPSTPAPAPHLAPPSALASAEDAADTAADNAGPRAMAVADLNTASVAELNGLKGGGMIGRSIVQKRPYTSVDQLLTKRVLNRATYQRIKDQVTVR